MEQLLPGLLSFPPHPPPAKPLSDSEYDTGIQQLLKLLNSTPASQLTKSINGSDSILTVLDPSLNPLPFLYAILAQINGVKKQANASPDPALLASIEQFVKSFDPVQIRYAGAQWKQLVDELLSLAARAPEHAFALKALHLVQQAMSRLDPGTSTFTSTHLEFVKVCLRRKAYDVCLPIIDSDIYHFPSDSEQNKHLPLLCAKHVASSTFITTGSGISNKLAYRDHLQYFLFGAMVYIARRKWSRALSLLEFALVSPVHGNTVSMVQVEAYKKWILVSILCHGRPGTLPRNISPQVTKYLNSLAKPYTVLADAFKEESPALVRGEFSAAAERSIWQRDHNLGLARLAVAAHRRTQVLSFSTIYSSIPLKTLSELISSSTAGAQTESPSVIEADLRHLINTQSIHASITRGQDGDDIVAFLSPTGEVPVDEVQQMIELRDSVLGVNALETHVKDAQSRLELSREYIEATKKRRKPAKEGVDMPTGVGDVQGIPGMDDEMLAEF